MPACWSGEARLHACPTPASGPAAGEWAGPFPGSCPCPVSVSGAEFSVKLCFCTSGLLSNNRIKWQLPLYQGPLWALDDYFQVVDPCGSRYSPVLQFPAAPCHRAESWHSIWTSLFLLGPTFSRWYLQQVHEGRQDFCHWNVSIPNCVCRVSVVILHSRLNSLLHKHLPCFLFQRWASRLLFARPDCVGFYRVCLNRKMPEIVVFSINVRKKYLSEHLFF